MATSCGFESHRPHQATLELYQSSAMGIAARRSTRRNRRKQQREWGAVKRSAQIIGWIGFGTACALFALMPEGGQRTGIVMACVVVAIICGLITGGKQE